MVGLLEKGVGEMKKQTVYLVTSGCYSDYRLDAIFSTREKAQKYINIRKREENYWDPNDIEEWTLDELEKAH